MKPISQLYKRAPLSKALLVGILVGNVPPLLALDLFGPTSASAQLPPTPVPTGHLPSLTRVAEESKSAVVNISTTQKREVQRRSRSFSMPPGPFGEDDPFEEFFHRFFGDQPPSGEQQSLGSGFLISPDGYIITNNHVVGNADTITVRLSDKEEYEARVIGSDDKTDIALIKINAAHPLPSVPLGRSTDLQVGDWVMAIGNPFGLEETVTAGIVSAKGRVIGAGPYDDFIQTDASINPGNSGGPLLNLKGEVIGINSAIFSQSGGNIGIGFAIPIDLAKTVVDQLRQSGKVTRGWLGVSIQPITAELAESFGLTDASGALVAEVTQDGPADQAGVKRGDVITVFDGNLVKDSHDLPNLVARTPVGRTVPVTVRRGGHEQNLKVTIKELSGRYAAAEERGENAPDQQWGMVVANITAEVRQRFQLSAAHKGVVVVDIEPGSPADSAGIQPGDVIEEVNRQPVESVEDFTRALAAAPDQDSLLLLAQRGALTSFFALRKAG